MSDAKRSKIERTSSEDEKSARVEIKRAIQASDKADPEESISGLGASTAPIYVHVRPNKESFPSQYNSLNEGGGEKDETPLFAYFAIKGLGEVQRMMFAEAHVPYDHMICIGGEEQSVAAEWRMRSPNGLLPTLSGMGIPRSSPISQSGAIIRFLAQKLGMDGGSSERGRVDTDWLYETAKDMGSHTSLVAKTKEGDAKDMAAKMPFSTAGRVAKVLATMANPKNQEAAINYGQLQLFKFLRGCEVRRGGCVKENLGDAIDDFRIGMESRTRLKAFLDSPLCFPFTVNEATAEGAKGYAGYSYAQGVTVSRKSFNEFSD